VITPTGEHLLANQCQNSDLFFALRGGGGGTFGFVLGATAKTHPQLVMNTYVGLSFMSLWGDELKINSRVIVTFDVTASTVQAFLDFMISNAEFFASEGKVCLRLILLYPSYC
jgi:FAD/FMN-containing dehydrogenase